MVMVMAGLRMGIDARDGRTLTRQIGGRTAPFQPGRDEAK
jgi:hypothetical protein